jgi:hypothetical protein
MTGYRVIKADGSEVFQGHADLPAKPDYLQLKAVIDPLLGGLDFERVNVWFDDRYTDMFVDECGMLKGLPRNERATVIYRANALKHQPDQNPEHLPCICGDVVLFARRVWF